jgi:hypothetical protein
MLIPLIILFISYQLNKSSKVFDKPKIVPVQPEIIPEPPIVFKTSVENPYMNYITNNSTGNNSDITVTNNGPNSV